jgi:hypothetical protein
MALALLVAGLTAAAPQSEPAKPDAKPAEVLAVFNDGTTIRKAVLQDNVEIATKYGKLTVPVADVRRIDFGLHVTEETTKKVETLIKQLGGDEFAQREAASKELVAVGVPALPALEAAARSPDKEVSTRAKSALERIRETATEEQLKAKPDDVIHTRDGGVLIGRIANPSLKARTDNFGELTFKLANLRFVQSSAKREVEVTVDAGPFHAEPEKWFDSGLVVERSDDLMIAASGQIELVPQTPGQAVAGPEGYSGGGRTGNFAYGTLIGRIGEKGEPFVAGKGYEEKALPEGRLYLKIVPIVGGNSQVPTGSYKVKITTGYDFVPEKKRPTPSGSGQTAFGMPAPALPSSPPPLLPPAPAGLPPVPRPTAISN